MNIGAENVPQRYVLKWKKVDIAIKPRGRMTWELKSTIYSSKRSVLKSKQVLVL